MTSSGAAYESDPHTVLSNGWAGSMKRDSPKSVSLMSECDGNGDVKGLVVRRMSNGTCESGFCTEKTHIRTLKLDIAVD